MNHKLLSLALIAVFTASAAAHASTATLNVTGKIVPAACTLSVIGSSEILLGNINADTLNVDRATKLPSRPSGLSVTCTAQTAYALKVVDEEAASLNPLAVATANSGALLSHGFGLGTSTKDGESVNIGAYVISLSEARAGGTPVTMASSDDGQTWTATTLLSPGDVTQTAWTVGNQPVPALVSVVSLSIDPAIIGTSALDLSNDIALAGKATIELVYL